MPVIRLRLLGGVELSALQSGAECRLWLAPQPLALLAYLAVAAAQSKPVRRDVLLALFWPEFSAVRARAALRQALLRLRRALNVETLRADRESVELIPDAIWCDVIAFEEHLALGNRPAALDLFRGELLEGFFVDGMSPQLEAWIDAERARLKQKAFLACRALADEAERSHTGVAAAHWARRAVALAPDDEIAVRRLIAILDTYGDRAGALRVADDFSRRLVEEFGTAPSVETRALVRAVRARTTARDLPDASGHEAVDAHPRAASEVTTAAPAPDPAPNAETAPAAAAPLGRLGRWRLTHRLTRRLTHNLTRRTVALVAALLLALLAGDLASARNGRGETSGAAGPSGSAQPALTIASPVARRLYREGLARYNAGDPREGARLLTAALAEDSLCAMCAYRAAAAYAYVNDSLSWAMLRAAMRLAPRVSEPERLLIHYGWADATNSPGRWAVADSLAVRYPDWPEAELAAADALGMEGDFTAAAAHLRHVISTAHTVDFAPSSRCIICEARLRLVAMYEGADSLPAALLAAQAAVRAEPRSAVAWLMLSKVLSKSGRSDEARAAMDTSASYATDFGEDVLEHAQIEIRAGNYATADGLLRTLAETGAVGSKRDALWYLLISLRDQGRLRQALALAEGPLRWADAAATTGIGISHAAEAQVLLEMGRYRDAANIFTETAAYRFAGEPPGRIARQCAWMLTHAGSALAAAGDTIAVAALADSVEACGARSGFGRDRRLQYYLRGLLWVARDRPDSAVVAFERATLSETQGFSRLQLERARALLALGRAREAIPVLRHPLEGTLQAGNFYATSTELQDLLSRAYELAGEPDSAAVYDRAVLDAWRGADPQFRPRIARVRARLVADERRVMAQR